MVQRLAGTMRPPRLLHFSSRSRATLQLGMLHATINTNRSARLRAFAARQLFEHGGRGSVQRRRNCHQTGLWGPSTAPLTRGFVFLCPQCVRSVTLRGRSRGPVRRKVTGV